MIQTCCALSRKHSALERNKPDVDEFGVGFGPTKNRNIGLLDYSNLSLSQLPLTLLNEQSQEVKHLILDENQLDEQALEAIPVLPNLETLSLNGNCIKNCGVLLQILNRKVPALKFLSLIGNPGWPHPILNANLKTYHKYVLSALQLFPALHFLDTNCITSENGFDLANKSGISTKRRSFASTKSSACHFV